MHLGLKIWDIHSHALLNMHYLKKDLGKRQKPPLFWNPLRNHIDLIRAKEGGVDCLTFNVYVPFRTIQKGYFRIALEMIGLLEDFTEKERSRVELAKTTEEVDRIISSGKIAATVAVEGGHILEGKLENLEVLKKKGVIYITLTHFHSNDIAEASFLKLWRRSGLTDFGKEVIKEMERLGILVDVTHTSERAFWEVLQIANAPVIYSHGGVRGYCKRERNLSDNMIKAIAEKSGVIGITFSPWSLKRWSVFGGTSLFVRTAAHISEVAGVDAVALGSDFDGWIWTLRDVRDISYIWRLVNRLLLAFNKEEVSKILYGNIRRVLKCLA